MADALEKGTVKWFNNAKGFGFIEHTSGRDVFVHYSAIETEGFRTLKDGEEVLYEIQEGPKGLHALRVQRVAAPASTGGNDDSNDDSESEKPETEKPATSSDGSEEQNAH